MNGIDGSESDSDAAAGEEESICNNVVKAKGVKRYAAKKISFKTMRSVIKRDRVIHLTQRSIQARKHVNRLVESHKKVVDSFDNKRYATCSIHTTPFFGKLARFHKKTGKCWACLHPERLY